MKYTWLVEKYLEGELEGEELRNFELEILRNPEAARELEEIRKLDAFCREQINKHYADDLLEYTDVNMPDEDIAHDLESLKIHKIGNDDKKFREFRKSVEAVSLRHQVHEKEPGKIILQQKLVWLGVAVISLLIGFSVTFILLSDRPVDLQALFYEHYEPYYSNEVTRDVESAPADILDLGSEAYRNANYGLALNYFNQVSTGSPSYTASFLFKGICYMELEQYERAIQSFNQLVPSRILNEYGEWYTGLCYLQLNDPDQARSVFERIVQKEGYFAPRAKAILKSL